MSSFSRMQRAFTGRAEKKSASLESLLSKALAEAVKENLADVFRKHKINEDFEKDLILSVDLFAPVSRGEVKWISVYLIKPGTESKLVTSFDTRGEGKDVVLRYKSCTARTREATAVLNYVSIRAGKVDIIDVFLQFSRDEKKWKKLAGS